MKVLCTCAFIITLLCPLLQAQTIKENTGEWVPFVIPEKLDPDSPMNIGKLVLDAPAGKHGFVTVKDGHFYFEDGTRAKFWGTNLCFSACFPTHKQAEMLADRIAFFGFNAVRLHHMDAGFEPLGIFKDIAPRNAIQQKKTSTLSPKQLDRLDYFIYQLKTKGIYVNINLLVSRHFTTADGVTDAEQLPPGGNPVSLFDTQLIELQKRFAFDLLTHTNPYTKTSYANEPCIALVEIANEQSLAQVGKDKLSTFYKQELEKLKQSFGSSVDDLFLSVEEQYIANMASFLKSTVKIKIPIGVGGHWNLTSFKAQKQCDYFDVHGYWDHPTFPNKPWDMQNFAITNQSLLMAPLLGAINYFIDKYHMALNNTGLKKPFVVSEWSQCYPNVYSYEMPILVAAKGIKYDWDAMFQFAFSHGWEKAPSYGDIHSYFDTIANPQQLILASIGGLIFLKNQPVNAEVVDGALIIKSANVQGIIGNIKNKKFTFDNLDLYPMDNGAILLYYKENVFNLLPVGEVKNTGAYWIDAEHFHWGTQPTLMKRVLFKIVPAKEKLNIKMRLINASDYAEN